MADTALQAAIRQIAPEFTQAFGGGAFDALRPSLTAEQNAKIDAMIAAEKQGLPGVQPVSAASMTPYQQQAITQMATPSQAIDPRISEAIGSALGMINTQQQYDPQSYKQFMNPYLDEVIARNAEDIGRTYDARRNNIDEAFAEAGGYGSTALGTERAQNTEAQGRQVGSMSAALRAQGFDTATQNALNLFNSNRANALSSAGILNNLASGAMSADQYGKNVRQTDLSNLLNAGNLVQQQNQNEINAYLNERNTQQQFPYQQSNYLQSTLSAYPTGGGTSTSTSPGVGALQGGIGGGMLGYSLSNQNQNQSFTPNPYVDYSNVKGGSLPWLTY